MSREERDTIVVSTFGGLNTTATPNSMPLTDATHLVNVQPMIGGGLEKRAGTRLLYRDSAGRFGVSMASVTTARGFNFVATKEGTALRAYLSLNDGSLYPAIQKNNVFSSTALKQRANVVVLNDIPTRVLFLTGVNKPVQLQFAELVEQITGAGGATSLLFNNAEIVNGLGASSLLLFRDRQLVQGTIGYTYNATTKQLAVTGLAPFNDATFELVVVTWQWWAEARQWYGDRFYNTAPRLHLAATTDVNVAIPEELRTDLTIPSTQPHRYPITAYPSVTSFAAPFTYDTGLTPTANTEYSFSTGAPYVSGTDTTTPTPLFVTFGAIIAASQATTVHFFRRRELKFNGVKRAVTGANLQVLVDGALVTQNITGAATAYGSYYMYKTESDAPTTNTTDEVKYVSFEAGNPMGIPSLSVVEMVNVERNHIGSAAIASYWKLQGNNLDGTYLPIHGIGDIADYFRGYYPTTAALFKTRLALGGFRHQPQVVIISAVFDTRTKVPYSFFQISDDEVLSTDPLDIKLPAVSEEKITALATWQDSNFVLTTNGVYRVSSGDNPVLSREAVQVSLMTRVGCVNANSVVASETGLYYLSQSGLFNLTARDNLKDQYDATAASLQVDNLWNILRFNTSAAWIGYDNTNKLVFVALPEFNLPQDYALKILVFHVQLSVWTEYYTHGHFRLYHGIYHEGRFITAGAAHNNTAQEPTSFYMLMFGETAYNLDFVDVAATTNGNTPVYAFAPYPMVDHTTNSNIREYATEGYKTGKLGGFKLSPVRSIRDVRAILNGVELVFRTSEFEGSGFMKLPNGNIYLIDAPPNGVTLRLFPRMEV